MKRAEKTNAMRMQPSGPLANIGAISTDPDYGVVALIPRGAMEKGRAAVFERRFERTNFDRHALVRGG